jgi:predicted metal-binding protein
MRTKAAFPRVEEVIRSHGAKDLARVDPADVVTAEWVRMKCQYGCGGYAQCLTCPPHSPTPEQTRKLLDGYKVAYVIWWGSEGPGRDELAQIEREVFLLGYYKTFLLAMGPCGLCDPCPLEYPCRHPEKARPAMEACGIDVFETAHRAGFPLRVVTSHDDTTNYYSLLLVE